MRIYDDNQSKIIKIIGLSAIGVILILVVVIISGLFIKIRKDNFGKNSTVSINDFPDSTKNRPTKSLINPQTIKKDLQVQAWIYPGEPACSASTEYKDGRKIDVLKPEYFTISENGDLTLLSTEESGCNGYSRGNVEDIKRYSKEQYVTVSSHQIEMALFFSRQQKVSEAVETLTDFVVDNNLTGIELDFEDYSAWSEEEYGQFISFITDLGNLLHKNGKKLIVDAPAIADEEHQSWYKWKHEEIEPLVDEIVIMAYDYQTDHGAGKPITPLDWLDNVVKWTKEKVQDEEKIVIGLPAYAYEGVEGEYKSRILTKEQVLQIVTQNSFTRDESSAELTTKIKNKYYFLSDSESIKEKAQIVQDNGIYKISLWHLGGNDWIF